ncbi:MAG: type II toxin-antitoxin system ParD family antitoxin [Bacteroidota bacterium]
MNVSLTPELERYARSKVESGRYNSASEVVRDALRLHQERDARIHHLRTLIHEGAESGGFQTYDRDEIRAMLRGHAAKRRAEGEM